MPLAKYTSSNKKNHEQTTAVFMLQKASAKPECQGFMRTYVAAENVISLHWYLPGNLFEQLITCLIKPFIIWLCIIKRDSLQ